MAGLCGLNSQAPPPPGSINSIKRIQFLYRNHNLVVLTLENRRACTISPRKFLSLLFYVISWLSVDGRPTKTKWPIIKHGDTMWMQAGQAGGEGVSETKTLTSLFYFISKPLNGVSLRSDEWNCTRAAAESSAHCARNTEHQVPAMGITRTITFMIMRTANVKWKWECIQMMIIFFSQICVCPRAPLHPCQNVWSRKAENYW